ncbi:LOW QUALITY PROTEIN: CMT1A duplicated region transcript 4 protein [Rhynchocyon petersi]
MNWALGVKERTENIGLPGDLIEKHDCWPAYVTYTSPVVKRLIEKSRAREQKCTQAIEESLQVSTQNKSHSAIQPKRQKSVKPTIEAVFKDVLTEPTLSIWGACSTPQTPPTLLPETTHLITDSREGPTTKYNKIIFSRKPMMKMHPYSSLLANIG